MRAAQAGMALTDHGPHRRQRQVRTIVDLGQMRQHQVLKAPELVAFKKARRLLLRQVAALTADADLEAGVVGADTQQLGIVIEFENQRAEATKGVATVRGYIDRKSVV